MEYQQYLKYFDPQEHEDESATKYALVTFYGTFTFLNSKWIFDSIFNSSHVDPAIIDAGKGQVIDAPVIDGVPQVDIETPTEPVIEELIKLSPIDDKSLLVLLLVLIGWIIYRHFQTSKKSDQLEQQHNDLSTSVHRQQA